MMRQATILRTLPAAILLAMTLTAVRGSGAPAAAPTGDIERRALIDVTSANAWSPAEATLTPTVEKTSGQKALFFHVPVDWKGGEKAYPIGWPRITLDLPAAAQDWSRFEKLRFRVLLKTACKNLPPAPLHLNVSSGGQRQNWGRDATGLQKDRWTEFSFNVADIPFNTQVRSMQFFVSESEYRDGDVLDFYLADVELVRHARPTLTAITPLTAVAFADDPAMPVLVEMAGVGPGEQALVEIALTRDGKTVASKKMSLGQGVTRVTLALPAGLAAGPYSLTARAASGHAAATVTLAPSPWQKEGGS